MAWVLRSDKMQFEVKKKRVIGRGDLPSDTRLSRRHIEVWPSADQKIFVQDLGSTNGTFLNGEKLEPQKPILLTVGDSLQIGDTHFSVELASAAVPATSSNFKSDRAVLWIVSASFFLQCLGFLFDSSLAFGSSIRLSQWGWLLGSLVAVTFAVAYGYKFLFRKKAWSWGRLSSYFALVLISSMVFHYLVMVYAQYKWAFGDQMVQAKIEYFCGEKFNQPECVRHVNLCPSCALEIVRWKRTEMVEKLKTYEQQNGNPTIRLPAAQSAPTQKQ